MASIVPASSRNPLSRSISIAISFVSSSKSSPYSRIKNLAARVAPARGFFAFSIMASRVSSSPKHLLQHLHRLPFFDLRRREVKNPPPGQNRRGVLGVVRGHPGFGGVPAHRWTPAGAATLSFPPVDPLHLHRHARITDFAFKLRPRKIPPPPSPLDKRDFSFGWRQARSADLKRQELLSLGRSARDGSSLHGSLTRFRA